MVSNLLVKECNSLLCSGILRYTLEYSFEMLMNLKWKYVHNCESNRFNQHKADKNIILNYQLATHL